MKSDVYQFMKKKGIDALIIMGKPQGNPSMLYFTGNIKLLDSVLLIKRGERPLLIHHPIDRDEAKKSGLPLIDFNYFEFYSIQTKNKLERDIKGLAKIFDKLKIKGKISFYGTMELSKGYSLLKGLSKFLKDIEVIEDSGSTILSIARTTKDEEEIEAIKKVGKKTCAVMQAVKTFLQKLYLRDGKVIDQSGKSIKIGDIKKLISQEMFNRGLIEEIDTICAMGKDAAIPHNYGRDNRKLQTGETLIIDIFPRSRKSGYFFDMSRTFCLGWLPDEIKKIYKDVLLVLQEMENSIKSSISTESYYNQACLLFESKGYKTLLHNPESTEGFVHSLGHGIGLDLHENPFLSSANPEEKLLSGMVFTLEPGLYFPRKEIGVRIEDVYYVDCEGKINNLTNFSRQMFIPLPIYK